MLIAMMSMIVFGALLVIPAWLRAVAEGPVRKVTYEREEHAPRRRGIAVALRGGRREIRNAHRPGRSRGTNAHHAGL